MIEFLKSNSKLQETLAEYAFLKDLLIDGVKNNTKVLVSRSDFDAFGYDILVQLEESKDVFKLQLKTVNGKNSVWDIHKSLVEDENGNVVLIKVKSVEEKICFEYHSIMFEKRSEILARKPIKPHSKKCRLNLGDLTKIENNELLHKILNYR